MTARRLLRVGLVGAGYVSEFHVQALQRIDRVQIVGVADLDVSRAQALADRYKLPAAFDSLRALTARGVDVVHVLTPPSSHAALTLQSLDQGCHVFVESPLATNLADCERIGEAARRAGRTVGVNHSSLCDPIFQQALGAVTRGDVGDVLSVTYLCSSNYPPYRGGPLPPQYQDGGYPFRDVGVRGLYMIQALLGEALDVSAHFTGQGGDSNLMFDEWTASVRCARGLGLIRLSWGSRPLQDLLLIEGTRGALRADLSSRHLSVHEKTRLPQSAERLVGALSEARQIATQVPGNVVRFLRGETRRYHGLPEMVRVFYERLDAGLPAPVSPQQAAGVVGWTERIARAADHEKASRLARLPRMLGADVLVTGGGGFIGRRLVSRLLAGGTRVRLLLRRAPDVSLLDDPRVEVVLGDLGDPGAVSRAVEGTRLVYHLGAATHGDSADYERGTIVGTRNVVSSVLRHAARLVYVSSLSVLHASAARPGSIVREDWPLEPHPERRGLYTNAKLQAEQIVRDAVRDRSLAAVILRPGQVLCPGGPLMTPAVAQRAGNRLVIIGNGRLVLPLIYVDDLVDALLASAERGVFDGSVFHIVDTSEVTQNELAARYRRAKSLRPSLVHVPRAAMVALGLGVAAAARILGWPAPISPYRIASALAPLCFDCSAARSCLGGVPRVGVERGLEILLGNEPAPRARPG